MWMMNPCLVFPHEQQRCIRPNRARLEAERTTEDSERIIEENLRDLTIDEMHAKIERLKARVDTYPDKRVDQPALPEDFDSSTALRNEAEESYELAQNELGSVKVKYDVAEEHHRELKEQAQKANVEIQVATAERESLQQELDRSRQHISDETLTANLEQARKDRSAAEEEHHTAKANLAEQNPEQTRALAENARKSALRAAQDLRTKQDEQHGVLANLELLGEKGLYDDHEQACTELERAESRLSTIEARSAAADLLFRTLERKRDEARRAYAAPLREKISSLGGYVFGTGFGVELDDDLSISSRTLDGKTLPFESLSIGAKEQLSIIARLASSLLADPTEGVPLIFDDTLGYSDPDRLEGMGAMLSLAGRHCQIIILTCTPGRFSHVGDAKVLSFLETTA